MKARTKNRSKDPGRPAAPALIDLRCRLRPLPASKKVVGSLFTKPVGKQNVKDSRPTPAPFSFPILPPFDRAAGHGNKKFSPLAESVVFKILCNCLQLLQYGLEVRDSLDANHLLLNDPAR